MHGGEGAITLNADRVRSLYVVLRAVPDHRHQRGRRDATLGEDACTVRHAHVATTLAFLNTVILALLDRRHVKNARTALRTFAANPQLALDLLVLPP